MHSYGEAHMTACSQALLTALFPGSPHLSSEALRAWEQGYGQDTSHDSYSIFLYVVLTMFLFVFLRWAVPGLKLSVTLEEIPEVSMLGTAPGDENTN